jgi:antitoxin YefM
MPYMFAAQLPTDISVAIETSYTDARANLARLLDRVTQDREVVVINRRGREDVAMIPASELSSLLETAYLLRSPKNARHLLEAMRRSLADEGTPATVEDLRREFGLDRDA